MSADFGRRAKPGSPPNFTSNQIVESRLLSNPFSSFINNKLKMRITVPPPRVIELKQNYVGRSLSKLHMTSPC